MSDGLFKMIDENYIGDFTMDLTPETLKQMFIDCAIQEVNQKREFVVMTGRGGHEMLNYTIEKQAYIRILHDNEQKFSQHEYHRVLDMLNSPDRENFELAKMILKDKV